jgi:hypothetical protein
VTYRDVVKTLLADDAHPDLCGCDRCRWGALTDSDVAWLKDHGWTPTEGALTHSRALARLLTAKVGEAP